MSLFPLFQYCLGSEKRTIGDFSSEQLLHDPTKSSTRCLPENHVSSLVANTKDAFD